MKGKFGFTLIFWILTVIVLLLVLYPIHITLGDKYQFYTENIAFIIIAITFSRFIFLTKFHWFSHNTYFKIFWIFGVIPVFMYLIDSMWDFQEFLDIDGIQSIMSTVNQADQLGLAKYIRAEMTLFWVGAMISTIALPMRMINSIWRLRNRGKV